MRSTRSQKTGCLLILFVGPTHDILNASFGSGPCHSLASSHGASVPLLMGRQDHRTWPSSGSARRWCWAMSSGRHRPVAAPLPHRFRLAISVESRPDARRRTPAALGKSIVEPEEHPADRFPEVEIDVAARIIKANMMTGRVRPYSICSRSSSGSDNPQASSPYPDAKRMHIKLKN